MKQEVKNQIKSTIKEEMIYEDGLPDGVTSDEFAQAIRDYDCIPPELTPEAKNRIKLLKREIK